MKIKGHTKIELFNAETGELEQVVEENTEAFKSSG